MARPLEQVVERIGRIDDVFPLRRDSECCGCRLSRELADFVVAEESFGIATGLDETRGELGQASAHSRYRELTLPDSMESSQDGAELIRVGELHLVEKEGDAGSSLLSGVAELEQDFVKIDVELPAVSAATLRVDVDREGHTGRHSRDGERSDYAERSTCALA